MTGAPGRVDRLAVYGTLAPGGSNHDVLADLAGTWRWGTLRGRRFDDGWHGYPGVVLGGAGEVVVSVLTAAGLARAWPRLDAFEGPGYTRVVTDVALDDGTVVQAHVYELAAPPPDLAGRGDGAA